MYIRFGQKATCIHDILALDSWASGYSNFGQAPMRLRRLLGFQPLSRPGFSEERGTLKRVHAPNQLLLIQDRRELPPSYLLP
jgi:hypothetical protein